MTSNRTDVSGEWRGLNRTERSPSRRTGQLPPIHQSHALWLVWQSCSVAEIDPNVLAEFNTLTQEAAELRRQSYGVPMHQREALESSRAFSQLSHRLLATHHLVESHPELQDDYTEWRRLYPTFTSDRADG